MLIQLALISSGGAVLWHKLQKNKGRIKTRKPRTKPRVSALRLAHDLKHAVLGSERQQLQLSLDSEQEKALTNRKQTENRKLLMSAGAVGLAALGTLSPILYVVGSAAVIYLGRHVISSVYRDFKKGHFISVQLVSVILMASMITTGQLLLAAMAGLMGGFLAKLIRKAEDSSQKQLINIFSGQPSTVWLEKDGVEIEVPFDTILKDDTIIVHAGEVIPVDGTIQLGAANIDQHILTGESQPIDKKEGDQVFAATLVLAGRISIRVETAGNETVAANIGKVLNDTKSYKDSIMLRGKKTADRLLPLELAAGAATFAFLGPLPAISILWSGLGYRMIMFGPMSVLNYLQILSRKGILIKDGRVLESIRSVDTVVFDKTGTLTEEQPEIASIHLLSTYSESQILHFAATAEHRQVHPVAKAIIEKARDAGVTASTPDDSSYEVGYGIKVKLEQNTIRVGSARFMQKEGLTLPDTSIELQNSADSQGHSLIFIGVNNEVSGALEIQPKVRQEAYDLITDLKARGITTYIISGDHEKPTRAIAEKLNVDHYFAETLPENKAEIVTNLRNEGKFVCFIGDGINDTIALKSAQISISLKGASSAATDTAQIIFMDGTLKPMTQLFKLTDEFEKTMHKNLLLSIAPGVLNIGGVYILHFGLVASMGLFYAGTTAGLVNTVLPLAKHQSLEKKHKNN